MKFQFRGPLFENRKESQKAKRDPRGLRFWFKYRLIIEKPVLFRSIWRFRVSNYCYLFPTTGGYVGWNVNKKTKVKRKYLTEKNYYWLWFRLTWRPK